MSKIFLDKNNRQLGEFYEITDIVANPEATGEEVDLVRVKIGDTDYKMPVFYRHNILITATDPAGNYSEGYTYRMFFLSTTQAQITSIETLKEIFGNIIPCGGVAFGDGGVGTLVRNIIYSSTNQKYVTNALGVAGGGSAIIIDSFFLGTITVVDTVVNA